MIKLVYSFSEAYGGPYKYKYTPYHHVFQEEAFRDLKWETGTHHKDFKGHNDSWDPQYVMKRMYWNNKTNTDRLQGWTIGWANHNLSVTAKAGRLLGLTEELAPKDISYDDIQAKAQEFIAQFMTREVLAQYTEHITKIAHAAGVAEAQKNVREALGIK